MPILTGEGGYIPPDLIKTTNTLMANQELSFSEIRRTLTDEFGLQNPTELLNLAQRHGRLSAGLDCVVMEFNRTAWEKFAKKSFNDTDSEKESSLSLLQKYAAIEPSKNEASLLDEFELLAPSVKQLIGQQLEGATLTNEEKESVNRFIAIREELHNIAQNSPMRLLLHFTNNGDLRFLWSINEKENVRVVGRKNQGGRVGTNSGDQARGEKCGNYY